MRLSGTSDEWPNATNATGRARLDDEASITRQGWRPAPHSRMDKRTYPLHNSPCRNRRGDLLPGRQAGPAQPQLPRFYRARMGPCQAEPRHRSLPGVLGEAGPT